MHIVVGSSTTCAEVVRKALDKCQVSEPPVKYQLAVSSADGSKVQLLHDEERPTDVLVSWRSSKENSKFILQLRTSGLIRVYDGLGAGYQSFQSVIVSPSMTCGDVLQIVVPRLAPSESTEQFQLVEISPAGECVIAATECPLLLQKKSSQLELRRKHQPASKAIGNTKGKLPAAKPSITPPPAVPILPQLERDDSPSDIKQQSTQSVQLLMGRLQLHSDLIEALKQFTAKNGDTTAIPSRERVLEQALIEQNQVVEVMQELISAQEMENKSSQVRINSQDKVIENLSAWEARAKLAEKELAEMTKNLGVAGSHKGSSTSVAAISVSEKTLAEKNDLIASLQAKLTAFSQGAKESEGEHPPTSAIMLSTRAKLEAERVRVIELEEELSVRREELNKIRSELSEKRSVLISKESEILHLRHEMEALKKFNSQRQDVVMRFRTSLMDKDVQLTSLTRALTKEKKLSEAAWQNLAQPQPVSDPTMPLKSQNLYEQVVGRNIYATELRRASAETPLGFSYTKVDLPVSSRAPCLVIKAVKVGSISYKVLQPGDEILEINGYSCRSAVQDRAIECLEKNANILRLVIARDQDPCGLVPPLHSTPLKTGSRLEFSRGQSTMWDTALSGADTNYVSVPNSSFSESQSVECTSTVTSSIQESHAIDLACDMNEVSTTDKIQVDISEMEEMLSRSEHARLELENELETVRSDLENIHVEYTLTKAENFELQEQTNASNAEMEDIQNEVGELQRLLRNVEDQVASQQKKIASLEPENTILHKQLKQAQRDHESVKNENLQAQEAFKQMSAEAVTQVKELKEQNVMLYSQNSQLKADIAQRDLHVQELQHNLENSTAEYTRNLSELEQRNAQLKAELHSLQETSTKAAHASEEEIEHLKVQLSSAKTLLMEGEMLEGSMKVEIRHLKQAADLADQQLAEAQQNLRKAEKEVGSYKQATETSTLEMESLTLGLKATQNKLQANKQTLLRLQNDVDTLRRNNAKLQTEKVQCQHATSKAEARIKSLEVEQRVLQDKLQKSAEEKDLLFQQLEDSIAETTTLQQETGVLKGNLQEMQGRLELSRQREAQLLKEVKEVAAAKKDVEQESSKQIRALKAEKHILEQDLSQIKHDVTTTKESSQLASDQEMQNISKLQNELEQQREALLSCEGEKARVMHECQIQTESVAKLSEEMNSLRIQNGMLTHTVDDLRSAKDDSVRELGAKQKSLNELSQKYSTLEERARKLEESCEVLRNEVKSSREESEKLTESMQIQQDQMLETQLQLQQITEELEHSSHDLQESKSTCDQLNDELILEKSRQEQLKLSLERVQGQVDGLKGSKKHSDDMVASMEFVHQQDMAKMEAMGEALKKKESELQRLSVELSTLQSNSRAQVQQLKVEVAGLNQTVDTMRKQLQETQMAREVESSQINEKLQLHMHEVSRLRGELEAEKSANGINQASISQLRITAEQAAEDRDSTQQKLELVFKQKQQLDAEKEQAKAYIAELEAEKVHLESTNTSLTLELDNTRQHFHQSTGRVGELTERLSELEADLDHTTRSLEDSAEKENESYMKLSTLQTQLEDALIKTEKAQNELTKCAVNAHAQEELISQLKASYELRQSECRQLQQSLFSSQSTLSVQNEKIKSLESEKCDHEATINEMKQSQNSLKIFLESVEKERQQESEGYAKSSDLLRKELQELQKKQSYSTDQINRLEAVNAESQSTIDQLMAAQEALRATHGDEKVLRLNTQITELENLLVTARSEITESSNREEVLESKMRRLEETSTTTLHQLETVQERYQVLASEEDLHRAAEAELTELHVKVSSLEDTLKSKTERLAEFEHTSRSAQLELKTVHAEQGGLLEKVTELASTKVSLVEKTAELERVQGELKTEIKSKQALATERDQLLSVLRKLEVEKHTQAIQQATPKLGRSADKEQLLELLRDKEEEAFRLREYVGKLLSNVVEKAPFVLEKMH